MIISPKVRPLRFWSQKVLPLVYDDSLSYYEVLGKMVSKINELIGYAGQTFIGVIYNEELEQIEFAVGGEESE